MRSISVIASVRRSRASVCSSSERAAEPPQRIPPVGSQSVAMSTAMRVAPCSLSLGHSAPSALRRRAAVPNTPGRTPLRPLCATAKGFSKKARQAKKNNKNEVRAGPRTPRESVPIPPAGNIALNYSIVSIESHYTVMPAHAVTTKANDIQSIMSFMISQHMSDVCIAYMPTPEDGQKKKREKRVKFKGKKTARTAPQRAPVAPQGPPSMNMPDFTSNGWVCWTI
eukprot:scaffold40298_cov24-Prasinocladus_malaysianus.AAC.1